MFPLNFIINGRDVKNTNVVSDNSQRDEAPNADVKSGFVWHYFNKEQLQILPQNWVQAEFIFQK